MRKLVGFCYLGSDITSDCRSDEDIKGSVLSSPQSPKVFLKKRDVLKLKIDLNFENLFKNFLFGLWLCIAVKHGTISSVEQKRIEALEPGCYRRNLKIIKLVDKFTNVLSIKTHKVSFEKRC